MKLEESFGIIPLLRKSDGSYSCFLLQLASGSHWGFPKGHANAGETAKKTAERELFEECALCVTSYLPLEPFYEEYQPKLNVKKRVTLFAALVTGDVKLQLGEILDGKWITLPYTGNPPLYPETEKVLDNLYVSLIH